MPMTSKTDDFQTLLAELGIEFTPPPGFVPYVPLKHIVMSHGRRS